MPKIIAVVLTITVFEIGGNVMALSRRPDAAPEAFDRVQPNPSLLAYGRKIFVARCASCHGEGGDKPLARGVPLSARILDPNVVAKMVRSRLMDAATRDREAVTAYILTLSKRQ